MLTIRNYANSFRLKTNETELGNKNVNQITEDDKKYLQHNEFSETGKKQEKVLLNIVKYKINSIKF